MSWLRRLRTGVPGPVAVLHGGRSAERDVSLHSGARVLEALARLRLPAYPVDIAEPFKASLRARPPACAFIALHGPGGEDGTVQRWLETAGIPYTGSGVESSALALDKSRCKRCWQDRGMPTPAWVDLRADSDVRPILSALGGDVMIKPTFEGSSIGIGRARDGDAFAKLWSQARQHGASVMAEAHISGAEYTVAVLEQTALPVIRIVVPEGFYDYRAKYQADTTRYWLPCGLPPSRCADLQNLALRAFNALGCRHWGRVDLMQDAAGKVWLLEANTVPGLTDHSLVPMAAAAVGMDFDALIGFIVAAALDLDRELPAAEMRVS